MKYFPNRQITQNPEVIIKSETLTGQDGFNAEQILGKFYLVSPVDAKEIFAIQNMIHGEDKFAPAKGNGIIVSAAALATLDAK